jgi:hypothetical protein
VDSRIKASQAQEKRVAKMTCGRVQPGSGNGFMHKADVRTIDFLIECKTTTKRSYSLSLDTILKVEREAILDGREFALFLQIDGRNVVVVDEDVFQTMREDSFVAAKILGH